MTPIQVQELIKALDSRAQIRLVNLALDEASALTAWQLCQVVHNGATFSSQEIAMEVYGLLSA